MAETTAAPVPMDVMVFGLARSGTTLVADLLTRPGRSVVISEPEIFKHWSRQTAARVHKLATMVGLDVGSEPPSAEAYGRSYARYFRETLAPKLATLERWGIKNVDFSGWRPLLKAFPPKRLILCVRDLRDTAISGIDRICRLGIVFRGVPRMRDEAWILAGLAYSVQELMAMRQLPHLVVRYEDLAQGPAALERIAEYVGLDGLEEDRLNLKAADLKRAWEIEKHQSRISAVSVGRFAAEPPGPVRALAERLWRLLPEYSAAFGYETPPPAAEARHDFAAAARATKPIDYLQTETWDWAGPAAFEPSFAQRRARIAVSRILKPEARAIDLCYGAPALRGMLPEGAALIRADAVSRGGEERIASLHLGELPSLEGANLALLLGMLEHVEDLPGLLRRLRESGLRALASYHATEDTAGFDRASFGWKSHLGREALLAAFAAARFTVTPRWAFDGRQSLFRLVPA